MQKSGFKPVRQFVRAGAGAGKTWNLTREVVSLAEKFHSENGTWPKTVLTTFTRKATQELKERMLRYCIEEKPNALEFVQATSYLNITTMHGLFSLFLSRQGHVLGFPSQFEVVDEMTTMQWRKKIVKDIIADWPRDSSLKTLKFSDLLDYLRSFEKTYWLGEARRIETVDDFEQLFLQLRSLLGSEYREIESQLRDQVDIEKWELFYSQKADLLSLFEDKTLLWEDFRQKALSNLEATKKPRASKKSPGPNDDLKKALTNWESKVKKWITEEEYSSVHWSLMLKVYQEFQNFAEKYCDTLLDRKRSEGALEADDLENLSFRIMKKSPEALAAFASDFDAWFVDEFQDTSPVQLRILENMMADKSQYLVGDPQQSIYLFRGSRSEIFFDKMQAMSSTQAEVKELEDNYRSQGNLLDFFNQFFSGIHHSFSTMNAIEEALPDDKAVVLSVSDSDSLDSEMAHITLQINGLLESGVSPKNIAILTRTHKDVDRLLKLMTRLGYPVMSHSSSVFYRRRETLDAMSILTFLLNPWDDKNLILLLRTPWMRLQDNRIIELIGDLKSHYWKNCYDAFIKEKDGNPGKILLQARYEMKEKGIAWVFRQLLIDLKMFDSASRLDPTGRREANLWKMVNLVEKAAREPGHSLVQFVKQGFKVSDLESVGDASDASSPAEPNKIILMTVHASKGLEFEYVFLPFLHKKPQSMTYKSFTDDEKRKKWGLRLPLKKGGQSAGHVLEELHVREMRQRESDENLRVLYVAMTRAEKHLYLSWTGKPGSQSWASLLESRLSQLENATSLETIKIEPRDGVPWAQKKENRVVRESYSNLKKEIQEKDLEKSKTFENWESLAKAHDFRRRGVVLHKVFESLKEQSLETTRELAQKWLPGHSDEVLAALEFIYSHEKIPFPEIIKNGFTEWGYQKWVDDKTYEKRIDLWAIHDEILWVVDYKTGSTKFKNKAFEQLNEYAEALVEYLKWDKPIKLAAVFPFEPAVFIEDANQKS